MGEVSKRPGPIFGFLGWLIALVFVGAIFLVWAVAAAGMPATVVPPPAAVFARLGAMLGQPAVWSGIGATLQSWAVGFVLGGSLGLVIGIPAGRTRIGSALLAPLALAVATLPAALLALLFILLEGLNGQGANTVPPAIMAFIAVAAVAARAQAGGATDRLRGIFHALEARSVAAFSAVLLVEMLFGRDRLGALAQMAATTFDAPTLYALLILAWLLGLVLALPFALGRWIAGYGR